jgi:ectoine hydroxylase-related dioxygenase (phytanoyl-CoA dioxygenase family)
VILGGAVDHEVLDNLKRKLDEDTEELARRARWSGTQELPGHLSQPMPCSREHIHPEIVTNPFVVQVTAKILGEGVHLHFYNGNTNIPGSGTQPLHRDAPNFWNDPIHPIISIVINMSPIDVDASNGATELWPSTQRLIGSMRISEEAEVARRAVAPPVRVITRKGDAVLRDPRLWHRGVPNPGTEPRHMIAMVHSKWFYEQDAAIPVTSDALRSFDHDVLQTRLQVVPDDYDYLSEGELTAVA